MVGWVLAVTGIPGPTGKKDEESLRVPKEGERSVGSVSGGQLPQSRRGGSRLSGEPPRTWGSDGARARPFQRKVWPSHSSTTRPARGFVES